MATCTRSVASVLSFTILAWMTSEAGAQRQLTSLHSSSSLTVTAPVAGEQLFIGRTVQINWKVRGTDAPIVAIALIPASGSNMSLIAWSAPNTGTYNWAIPRNQAVGRYQIAVRAEDTEGRSGSFTISKIPAGLAPPNVSSFAPSDRGYVNFIITFNGRDFIPNLFTARVGAQRLQVLTKATNKVEARLPVSPITGDLVVSHGTAATEYVLKRNYRVSGDAVISDAQPRTISRGTIVAVTGTDLWGAYPYNWGANQTAAGYVGLTNATSVTAGAQFVKAYSWDVSEDGTSATFQAFDVWTAGATGNLLAASPQPASLTGTLRLTKIGSSNNLAVVGPTLTWQPPAFTVTRLAPPAWGTASVDFVLVPFNGSTRVSVYGTGLDGSSASMGNVAMLTAISYSGVDGWFEVPYNALTDYVIFRKGAQSAQSPQRLAVIPSPRMQDPDTTALAIKIDQDFSLRGWDLAPPVGAQLTYPMRLTQPASALGACGLQFSVRSQTSSEIRVRFATSPGATIPAACLGSAGVIKGQMVLFAELGGVQRELWRRSYYVEQ